MILNKNKEWKYSKRTGLFTTKIESLSLTDIAEQYCPVKITRYSLKNSLDVSNEQVMRSCPETGIYCFDTVPKDKPARRRNEPMTFNRAIQAMPVEWKIPHPSVLIQAARIYSNIGKFSGKLLTNQNQKVWKAFNVLTENGVVPVHARIWLAKMKKPSYRLELFHPQDEKARRTYIIRTKKVE